MDSHHRHRLDTHSYRGGMMNKTTEALKMAIEALETLAMPKGESIYKTAINACKEALQTHQNYEIDYAKAMENEP